MLIFENRLAASEFITIRWCSVATLARVTEIIKQRRGWRGPFWPAMAHVRNAEHGRAEKPEIISTKSSPPRFIAVIRHFLSRDSPPPFARPRRSGSLRFKRPRDRYAKLNLRVRAWSNYSYEVSFFFFFFRRIFRSTKEYFVDDDSCEWIVDRGRRNDGHFAPLSPLSCCEEF